MEPLIKDHPAERLLRTFFKDFFRTLLFIFPCQRAPAKDCFSFQTTLVSLLEYWSEQRAGVEGERERETDKERETGVEG